MLGALALLAAVLPPWEEMRTRRVVGQHYDETLPDGRTIKVTQAVSPTTNVSPSWLPFAGSKSVEATEPRR
jgi:hypothetical protein